jgi:hypothetical protein
MTQGDMQALGSVGVDLRPDQLEPTNVSFTYARMWRRS